MFKEITIIGNLGNDPEIRHLPSGTIAGNFSVAINDPPYTDRKTGDVMQQPPTWMRVVAYQTGETGLVTNLIQKWLRKGQLVYVKGDPIIRKYIDQQGVERQAFEIKLGPQAVIKMLGGDRQAGPRQPAAGTNGVHPPAPEKGDPGPGDIDLGDIPI